MKSSAFTNVLFAVALLVQGSGAATEDTVVVVSRDNPSAELERGELKAIFQSKVTQWDNGARIMALNLPKGSKERVEFDQVVLGFTQEQAASYWIDQKIRGAAPAPQSIGAPLVPSVVSANARAVGYMPASQVTAKLRIVARISNGRVVAP